MRLLATVLALGVAVGMTGSASAQSGADEIAQRQALMKLIGASFGSINPSFSRSPKA